MAHIVHASSGQPKREQMAPGLSLSPTLRVGEGYPIERKNGGWYHSTKVRLVMEVCDITSQPCQLCPSRPPKPSAHPEKYWVAHKRHIISPKQAGAVKSIVFPNMVPAPKCAVPQGCDTGEHTCMFGSLIGAQPLNRRRATARQRNERSRRWHSTRDRIW